MDALGEHLQELGWERLGGKALNKANAVFGHDLGSDVYARKFGRKTVFLRDCQGVLKLRLAFDRDDPRRESGVAIAETWPMFPGILLQINDIASDLVARFHDL